MAFGSMLGGIASTLAGKVGGALAKKKPTGEGATPSKPMQGSKAASRSPKRKFRLGIGRSMSMR